MSRKADFSHMHPTSSQEANTLAPPRRRLLHVVADCSGSMVELGRRSALRLALQSIHLSQARLSLFGDVQFWLLRERAQEVDVAKWDGELLVEGRCDVSVLLSDMLPRMAHDDAMLFMGDGEYTTRELRPVCDALAQRGIRMAAVRVGPCPAPVLNLFQHVWSSEELDSAVCFLAAGDDFLASPPDGAAAFPSQGEPLTAKEEDDEW